MTEITCQAMFMKDAMFMYTQVTLVTNRQSTSHASLLAEQQRVVSDNVVIDQ